MDTNMSTPAERVTRGPLSTPQQRLYIRCMFRQLELDTRRATLFHGRFWQGANVTEPPLGTDLDAYLCALSKVEATRVIRALEKEVPRDE